MSLAKTGEMAGVVNWPGAKEAHILVFEAGFALDRSDSRYNQSFNGVRWYDMTMVSDHRSFDGDEDCCRGVQGEVPEAAG